jgi:hypothetical protein
LIGLKKHTPIIQHLAQLVVCPEVDFLTAAALVYEQQRTARPHKRQFLQPIHFLDAEMPEFLTPSDEFHDAIARNIVAIVKTRRQSPHYPITHPGSPPNPLVQLEYGIQFTPSSTNFTHNPMKTQVFPK